MADQYYFRPTVSKMPNGNLVQQISSMNVSFNSFESAVFSLFYPALSLGFVQNDVTQFFNNPSPFVTRFVTKALVPSSQNHWHPHPKTVTLFMDDPLLDFSSKHFCSLCRIGGPFLFRLRLFTLYFKGTSLNVINLDLIFFTWF